MSGEIFCREIVLCTYRVFETHGNIRSPRRIEIRSIHENPASELFLSLARVGVEKFPSKARKKKKIKTVLVIENDFNKSTGYNNLGTTRFDDNLLSIDYQRFLSQTIRIV